MTQRVSDLLDEKLRAEYNEGLKRERSGKWNPSAFGQCFRRQYWRRENHPQSDPIDDRGLKIFKVGHMFEEFIFSLFKSERQVKVEVDNVLGYADGVGEDEVQEIKTQHSFKFWHINKAKKEDPDFSITKECSEHVLQGMFYVQGLKKKFLRLVYISKDDLCIDEYVIPYTSEMESLVNNEISVLDSYWANKELPPALPRLYLDKKTNIPKECQYCNFRTECKGGSSGE